MSGIVFGCIAPHPPIVIPEVAAERKGEIARSAQAMERLAQELARSQPQTMLVISPHGPSYFNAMGILTAPSSRGDLRTWGVRAPDFYFDNDLETVALIQEEARTAGVPLKPLSAKGYQIDYGALVPLYFLSRGLKGVAMVPLTYSWLPRDTHFAFGQAIQRAAKRADKRIAVIASGDLSHRLFPGAPSGYDPLGKVYDQKIVELVGNKDVKGLMSLDEELLEHAGEDAFRSILILMGCLEGLEVRPEVLSYEGPFGVGYMVACFHIGEESESMEEEEHYLVRLARETVETYVLERQAEVPKDIPAEAQGRAGVFVSLHAYGQLRGCIGTFQPTRPNLAEEVVMNAISSATRDPRFLPVAPEELADLIYSVDVLSPPEPVRGPKELDPKRYGVIVERGRRRGLLLPDLEGVETVEEQIDISKRKAGILPEEPVKLYRFQVTRYR